MRGRMPYVQPRARRSGRADSTFAPSGTHRAMSSSRENRVAENEAAFRAMNERIRGWSEQQQAFEAPMGFLCECGDQHCVERVYLTRAEYEAVRADPMRFALSPGHEKLDTESVVERHAGYTVVAKDEGVRHIVEETDPRRS